MRRLALPLYARTRTCRRGWEGDRFEALKAAPVASLRRVGGLHDVLSTVPAARDVRRSVRSGGARRMRRFACLASSGKSALRRPGRCEDYDQRRAAGLRCRYLATTD